MESLSSRKLLNSVVKSAQVMQINGSPRLRVKGHESFKKKGYQGHNFKFELKRLA